MDLKDAQKPRGWPWKKKNGFGEGGTSPPTVKLFDEQEVARILEDQIRCQKEEMDITLREVDDKYGEKERAINEKLNKALAEITVKDNLVKQHIKVAEEAVIGWERAENEAAAFKLQLECALQQKLANEDRVEHLDGALKEVMKQLRGAREEQEQRIHEAIVKKTQEYDKLRLEMESKLAEASHMVAQTRAELIESRAENKVLTHALQERSRVLAEVNDNRVRAETDMKVLQMRLDGMEKENVALKCDIHLMTKELETRISELEHGRKAVDMATKQHAEAMKKVTKLDEECNRLRTLLRKKLPSSAAMVRVKQDVDASGRDQPGKVSPRRRPLGKSQSAMDQAQEAAAQESWHAFLETNASAEKILNLEEETRMLKEALAKRNDELQNARIMCAKTASRLSSVEEEVEALRAASKSSSLMEKVPPENWPSNILALSDSSLKGIASKRETSLNFELMDDFEEMERLANSQSQSLSISGSEHTAETALTVFGAVDESSYQLRIVGLEEALAVKDRDLETEKQVCHELSKKLSLAEEQLLLLQSKNAANERSVIDLQDRLDLLLEGSENSKETSVVIGNDETGGAVRKLVHITEALAQATGTESAPPTSGHHVTTNGSNNVIVSSLRWQDGALDASMSRLVQAANGYLEGGVDVLKFVMELMAALDCILIIHITANEESRKERDVFGSERVAISRELESARVTISQLEEELCRLRAEQADIQWKLQVDIGRASQLDAEVERLRMDKADLENNMSEMDQHLVEANARVESLRVRLGESEALVKELQTRQAAYNNVEKEDDMIERELLELSSPNLALSVSMRAADAEMHQLHDKVAVLEVELQGERRRHQEVVSKLEDMQEQIYRGVGRMEPSSGRSINSREDENNLQLIVVEDDTARSERKEKEITAAALAECQRTILTLGKQLRVLGLQDSLYDLPLATPASPDSIEKMTHAMEFLRTQADLSSEIPAAPSSPGTSLNWASRPGRSGLLGPFHRQTNNGSGSYKNGANSSPDGPSLLNCAEQSDSGNSIPDTPSSPASPVRVMRSVRTIRGSASNMKAASDNTNGDEKSLDPSSTTPTTPFRRFYSRSQSETSMSSDHSNPGPV